METDTNYIIFHHMSYTQNSSSEAYNSSDFSNIFTRDAVYRVSLPNYPEGYSDSMSSTFGSSSILSRSAPIYSYVSSGPRSVSISMKLHREQFHPTDFASYGDSYTVDNPEEDVLDRLIDCLQMTVTPVYDRSSIVVPPKVTVSIGSQLKVTGIVSNCRQLWELPVIDGRYQVCTISFDVSEIDAYSAEDILVLGGRR